ncbi:hypothetical protein GCM10010109_88950 [Actinoplanes campanulatus]|nr:hypothetical protein GCM10010109_88950 [Actinoplanes campanulatus]GID42457.1 hypothetical protein Aca09nite_89630 [Actinoplanes campanulatus]
MRRDIVYVPPSVVWIRISRAEDGSPVDSCPQVSVPHESPRAYELSEVVATSRPLIGYQLTKT